MNKSEIRKKLIRAEADLKEFKRLIILQNICNKKKEQLEMKIRLRINKLKKMLEEKWQENKLKKNYWITNNNKPI